VLVSVQGKKLHGFAGLAEPFLFSGEEFMNTTAALSNCRDCTRWKEAKHRIKVSELLTAAMMTFESGAHQKEFKPSLAEYLKLLQLEREFDEDEPKEITVTWIDPGETSYVAR
jgi:hypothetical protein